MKSWFPAPWLSVCLLAIWLLLNQSLELGQILFGILLAIAIPVITAPLRPNFPAVTRPIALFRLLSYALVEIIRSSFNVSRIILFRGTKNVNSQFIIILLDMDNPAGLALLSCLINSTPGTVWVEYLATGASYHCTFLIYTMKLGGLTPLKTNTKSQSWQYLSKGTI